MSLDTELGIQDTSAVAAADELKLCINCAHVGTNASRDSDLYKCFAPQNFSHINLVDGRKMYKLPLCAAQRTTALYTGEGMCEEGGNWYEAAPPKQALVEWTPLPTVTGTTKPVSNGAKLKPRNTGTNLLEDLGM